MDIRKAVAAALVAATAAIGSTATIARTYVDIEVAPPAPRYEAVPAPRAGYVWAPGYWAWDGYHHRWHRGHWERERHGYAWVAPRWEQHGQHWRFDDGHWERHH